MSSELWDDDRWRTDVPCMAPKPALRPVLREELEPPPSIANGSCGANQKYLHTAVTAHLASSWEDVDWDAYEYLADVDMQTAPTCAADRMLHASAIPQCRGDAMETLSQSHRSSLNTGMRHAKLSTGEHAAADRIASQQSIVKLTLAQGMRFVSTAKKGGYGQHGAWTYVFCLNRDQVEIAIAGSGLSGSPEEFLGFGPYWHVVTTYLEVPQDMAHKPQNEVMPITAFFCVESVYETLLDDLRQHLMDWLEEDYAEDDVPWMQQAVHSLQEALKDYYLDGKQDRAHKRQLGHMLLGGTKALLSRTVQRNLPQCVEYLLKHYSPQTAAKDCPWLVLADVSFEGDRWGNTALDTAAYEGLLAPLRTLLAHVMKYSSSQSGAAVPPGGYAESVSRPWAKIEFSRSVSHLIDVVDATKNKDAMTCLELAESRQHWHCWLELARCVKDVRGIHLQLPRGMPKTVHMVQACPIEATKLQVTLTLVRGSVQYHSVTVPQGISPMCALADFLAGLSGTTIASQCKLQVSKLLYSAHDVNPDDLDALARVFQICLKFKSVVFHACVLAAEMFVAMLREVDRKLDILIQRSEHGHAWKEIVIGVMPLGCDAESAVQAARCAFEYAQAIAGKMVQLMSKNQLCEVRVNLQAFQVLDIAKSEPFITGNLLNIGRIMRFWNEECAGALGGSEIYRKERFHHPFYGNPFMPALMRICDVALGRRLSNLRDHADIASAVDPELRTFLKQLLATWHQIIRHLSDQSSPAGTQKFLVLINELDAAIDLVLRMWRADKDIIGIVDEWMARVGQHVLTKMPKLANYRESLQKVLLRRSQATTEVTPSSHQIVERNPVEQNQVDSGRPSKAHEDPATEEDDSETEEASLSSLILLEYKGSTNVLRDTLLQSPELHQVRESMIDTGFEVQPAWAGGAVLLLSPSDAAVAEMLVTAEFGKPLARNCVLVSEEFEDLIHAALENLPYRKRPRVRQASRLEHQVNTADHAGMQPDEVRQEECDHASGYDFKADEQQTIVARVSSQPIAACIVELQSRIVLKNSFLHLRSGLSDNSDVTKSTGDRMKPRWKNPRAARWVSSG